MTLGLGFCPEACCRSLPNGGMRWVFSGDLICPSLSAVVDSRLLVFSWNGETKEEGTLSAIPNTLPGAGKPGATTGSIVPFGTVRSFLFSQALRTWLLSLEQWSHLVSSMGLAAKLKASAMALMMFVSSYRFSQRRR
jgi:hypothetical protein